MKKVNGEAIIQAFERFSPKSLAFDGDKIGLQIGTLSKPVAKVMITLDVNEQIVDEAVEKGAELIISHHPLIFKPLEHVRTDSSYGRAVQKLLKHDIALYTAHTNLDNAKGGVNDLMAEALGLQQTDIFVPAGEDPLKKLIVFVPEETADEVREALGEAGAGHIGDYSHCSFNAKGTGAFKPGDSSNPHIGKQGEMEFVNEVKVETVYPHSIEKTVLNAMKKAHPYEEVAYDVYDLAMDGEVYGLGRIGYLPAEESLERFCERVKNAFDISSVRAVGDLTAGVKKVAVLGGDGNKYAMKALHKGADVYVTGDIYYHVAHDAMNEGLKMVDPGHHTEKIMKKAVADRLNTMIKEKQAGTNVFVSEADEDPFQFV
ncbi:Nif3-like dinuclear metal center hexameric protein [Salisediminibacterium halotolerans]|uniref:Nif3-like dinuclear metal center hexameric protein n=1 Tax=Salisediminibacterium halotolerans TaxID=517425 RepID=UPI000EB233C0|nr:Nif3-like dinuclear metal center hexameric protein [Salisediminibacterium halotolerans]RLJ78139.1 dinuclear metal center YbgI/SA1388 family protein [Actinophytocola xinjiangensis]RPE88522.1 dinuclear metal center YbgI/SA1388 family protein [Salisediminibacterium halotolerans]TWG37116.1 dinuclear metal center YbgI/SA1388 family protein [Salisediminibacterium halotolerans]GEL07254.1 GTP cyclohydrolase 1 type 2 [Salisediminibacterium halotolerans]